MGPLLKNKIKMNESVEWWKLFSDPAWKVPLIEHMMWILKIFIQRKHFFLTTSKSYLMKQLFSILLEEEDACSMQKDLKQGFKLRPSLLHGNSATNQLLCCLLTTQHPSWEESLYLKVATLTSGNGIKQIFLKHMEKLCCLFKVVHI